ncbi:hypothetical protein T459_28821 [Capsicum annuum]|uniref:Uncharacterized protein n=1 Tax=Capsicum annuum TaxID=4072 RepID=A0A2G2YHW0_CAPAN|nr:hypothetical protein FXO37_19791 [Capsicum annuum]PHT69334.1 hypothetical protein T459_28821 [Capsicum annuum]
MMRNNFFFFRSSTNDANKTPSPPLKSKEVSSWRSASLSSGSFYDSGPRKKNFMDLRKSPHGHSKKVYPKKSDRDLSRDLSVPVLIQTIRRLTKKKVLKKDKNIYQLTNDLQECIKELGVVKAILPKVFQERDFMWEKVKSYSEINMLLNYEINILKRNIDTLNKDFLMKEGQITILNDLITLPQNGARTRAALKSGRTCTYLIPSKTVLEPYMLKDTYWRLVFICQEVALEVHQNSTCGAAKNVGTAAKPNGIMQEPVHADRPNAFSNNSSSILSCIQTAVDIPSEIVGPSMFELLNHALVRPGREENRCLRQGFRKKDQNSYASSSEGCGSSVKRSSSADAGHLGNATVPCTGDGSTWNNIEGINSDNSMDSGRPSLDLHSSSCRSVVHEPEVGSLYVDRNLEHNSSMVFCSRSGLESQGGDSSTSTSANQHILDLNLALAFQES